MKVTVSRSPYDDLTIGSGESRVDTSSPQMETKNVVSDHVC